MPPREPICESPLVASMQVRDPVCGMEFDAKRAAAHGTYGGTTVYFCSAGCKATYDRSHPAGGA